MLNFFSPKHSLCQNKKKNAPWVISAVVGKVFYEHEEKTEKSMYKVRDESML